MAISLVAGSALSAGVNNGAAVTHTFPAGVLQNDVVLVMGACATSITMTTAGYTLLSNTSNTNNVSAVWMKAMGATPDTSVTVTGSGNANHRTQSSMYILRGADPGRIDVSASATGSSVDPNPPSVTTRFANDWVVVFASSPVNDITITAPTNYVNLTVAGGTDATLNISMTSAGATRLITAAGVEDPAAFGTWITGAWTAYSIGIREWQENVYWVGGTGTWDNSTLTNWSLTSGGTAGTALPGSRSNVIFDANSDSAGALTVTISTGATCQALNMSAVDTGPTISGSVNLSINGSITLPSSVALTSSGYTGTWDILASSTLTSNTRTLPRASFNASGGTLTLADAATVESNFTLTQGTLSLGTFAMTVPEFSSSNTNTRSISFGTGKIVLTSAAAVTTWNTDTATNLTVSGTPLVESTGGGATTKTINTGVMSEANSISFSILNTAGTVSVTGTGQVVRNLTLNCTGTNFSAGPLTIYGDYTFTAGSISGGASAWTFAATSGTKTINGGGTGTFHSFPVVFNGVGGTWQLATTGFRANSFTLTNGTLALSSQTLTSFSFSSNNANTRSITATTGRISVGGGITSETVFDTGTITGLTTNGNIPVDVTGANLITRTINSGALGEASAFSFSILSTSGTVTFTASNTVRDLTISASGTTITNIALTIFGSYSYTAGTLSAGANAWTFAATGSRTLNSGGAAHDFPITFNGVGGTWTLTTNNLTVGATRTTTLTTGTLALGTLTLSTGVFSSNNANARTISFGTGKIVITGTNTATVWDTGTITNLTVSGTPVVDVTGSAAVTRTINSGTLVEASSINFNLLTSAGTITFTATNTTRDLVINAAGTTISNIAITIYGDYTYTAGTLTAGTNTWTFAGTDTETITTGGTLHDFPFTFGSTGLYTLGSNLVSGSTRTATLNSGTLVLGSFNFTTGIFNSATTNTRSVTATSGRIILNYSTALGATIFNTSTITGLTTTGNPIVQIANTAAQICTINSGALSAANAFSFEITATVGTTTFTAANTMWDLTISGAGNTISNIAIVIYGSYSYTAGTLTAGTNAWTFAATTSEIITGSGTTHDFPITFNGAGGTWTLGSNFTVGATRLTTLTTGTLAIATFTLSTGQFNSSNANTRSVSATSGTISITFATAATVFDTGTITNMTNTGNPTITLGGSAAVARIVNSGALSEANAFSFNITSTAGTTEFTNTNTIKNLIIAGTGHVVSNRTLIIYGNYSYTAGTLLGGTNGWTFGTTLSNTISSTTTQEFPVSFNGTGGTWTLQNNFTVGSSNTTTLTAGTLSLNNLIYSTGFFNSDVSTSRSIGFGSSGNIVITGSGSTVWNTATLTNLSITGTQNVNLVYSGASGTRTISHGSTAGGSESTSLSFKVRDGDDSLSITSGSHFDDLDFTGFSGFWNNSALSIYGNLIVSNGMVAQSGTGAVTFNSSLVTQTITSNGKTLDFPITKNGTATLNISGNLTMGTTSTSVFTLTQGTFDVNNNWMRAWGFASNNSNTRTLAFGANRLDLFGNNGTVLNIATGTGLTVTGSRAFEFDYSGATGTRTITLPLLNAGGTEANSMDVYVSAGTDIVTVGGASAAAAATIRNLDFTGFAGTWSQTSTGSRKIYGNLSLWPTMTISSSTLITEFSATSGTQIITSTGETMDFPVTFNGTGNYLLFDPMTIGSTRTTLLTSGNLDLNYNTLTTGIFNAGGTTARRIDFDGGAIVINGSGTTVLAMNDATNYTYTGFSNVWLNYSGSVGTRNIAFGSSGGDTQSNVPNATVHGGGDAIVINGGGGLNDFYMVGGFNGSLDWSGSITLYGNIKVPATATVVSSANSINFASTANTKKVDFSNVTVDRPVTFNGAGGNWDLASNLIMGSTRTFTVTTGNLNMNNYIVTTGLATVTSTNPRSLDFGTQSQIYITGSGGTVWSGAILTNMTVSGNPRVNFNYTGAVGTRTITHGTTGGTESTAITANVTDGTDTVAITGHFRDINYYNTTFAGTITQAGTVNVYGNLSFSGTQISNSGTELLNLIPSSGSKNISGNGSTVDRPLTFNGTATWDLQSSLTVGPTRTTTLTSGNLNLGSSTLTVGNLSSNGSTARSIGFGTGKIVVTGVSNTVVGFATATNFETSGTRNIELSTASTTGTRTINFGGTAGATESNSLSFNVQAGSDTVSVSGATGDLVFWGFTGSWTPSAIPIYGNLYINPSQTIGTSASAVTMAATIGNRTITTGSKTFDFPLVINAPGASYSVSGPLTMGGTATSTLTYTAGNINMGTNQITVPTSIAASGSAARVLTSNTAVILSGSGTVLSAAAATNISMNGDGYFVLSSASAKTFAGGSGNSYLGLIQSGAGLLSITGSNTFRNIANSALPAPVRFEAGSTTTFTQGFNLRGAGGTKLVIDSSVPGTAATLSLSSGTVRGQDLTLSDSTATGGALWYAGATSIDLGNNTGWIFDGVPLTVGRGISLGRGITIT